MNIDQLSLPAEIEAALVRLSVTYEFQKLSDKGANGYLFIARNRVLQRDVALKFYYWADGYRAHVEPTTLAAVHSTAIIEVLDAAVVGEEWALFVTPYCGKGDLDRYRETHRFGLREAARFVEQLLHGVSALHAARFVHRDLKPENILVSDSSGPLIADFGSVRLVPEAQNSVSGSGHAVLYRPPESFSSATYDRRGDIYQCGIILYQLLGGRLSYAETSYLSDEERRAYAETIDDVERCRLIDAAIGRLASEGTLLRLDTLPFFVPSRLKQVITKATHPAPAQRFQQASDMLSAITRARERSLDWRFENDGPVCVNDCEKLRLVQETARSYSAYLDRGRGWRRAPGTKPLSVSKQLRWLETRCL